MAVRPNEGFDINRICKECAISEDYVKNTPITIDELKRIYDDFISGESLFKEIKADILTLLNSSLSGKVHSIRARTKNPDHLIGKILRNINEKPKKYSDISINNYNHLITDLIGIRIIILNKHDWKEIHTSLLNLFNNNPDQYAINPTDLETNFAKYETPASKTDWQKSSYHAEKPVVYITSEDDRNEYIDDFLKVDTAKKHYRSIHYIVRYGSIYFEIQVRTLFEEGWLEFDHRVKYPNDRTNPKKQEYIEILSSLAVAADRLISFYNEADFITPKCDMPKDESTESATDCSLQCYSAETIHDKIKLKF